MAMPRPIWAQWKRLTRFHNVTSFVLAQEGQRALSFPAADRGGVQLAGPPFTKGFKLKLSEYDGVVGDVNVLSEMVLTFSWALFESHCLAILDETKNAGLLKDWKIEFENAVESWGGRLLIARGASWSDVLGGEEAIIEAVTLRNALSHGQLTFSQSMHNRLTARGVVTSWKIGDPVTVDFSRCEALRASLKSYARLVEAKPKLQKGPPATRHPRGKRRPE